MKFRHRHVFRGASQVVLVVKNLPASAEDVGLIPGLARSLGGGYGNPLQYPCLENSMDRGAPRSTVLRVSNSWTQLKWLSTHVYIEKTSCHHVKLGVLLSQSKTAGKPSEAKRTAWKRSFPSTFRASMALATPWTRTSSLYNCETTSFCFLSHLVCSLCYNSHNKWIHSIFIPII